MTNPWSLGADPSSGHVYVGEASGNRVSEFTAWGEFVKAWGWGVRDGVAEPETCGPGANPPSSCQAAIAGEGGGQFNEISGGLVVDSVGDVFVVDRENHRVQKFSSDGEFILTFGGEVNKTKSAEIGTTEAKRNLCTAASGDQCGGGVTGTGQGEFSTWTVGAFISIGSDETVYVGDKDRIQEFNLDGSFKGELSLPESGLVKALAIDPTTGALYMAYDQGLVVEVPTRPYVFRHTESGWEQFVETGRPASGESDFPIHGFPLTLATSSQGDLYAATLQSQAGAIPWEEVVAFAPDGECLEGLCPGSKFAKPSDGTLLRGPATSHACGLNEDALYLGHFANSGKSYLESYGEPPDAEVCPPPARAPSIDDQFAASVGEEEAVLRARISSHFWPTTTYYLEYGTEPCSLGGCIAQPLPPGMELGSHANLDVLTEPITITGLAPNTTYHYRFVARTVFEPGPGGEAEVKGLGGEVGSDGAEGEFTTEPGPPAFPPCGNEAFRGGASALLPDCRAYEMVSPVDKLGGDALLLNREAQESQVNQSALDGGRFTYSTYRAFAEPEAAPNTSQYLATRGAAGWSSDAISPPRRYRVIGILNTAASEFTAFSSDLCKGWLLHQTDHPPFAPGAIEGYANLYSRTNCEAPPAYEAITRLEAPISEPNNRPEPFVPELQGLSADGACAVFRANARLIPEASEQLSGSEGIYQTYENCGGSLRLVSVLPEGEASSSPSTAGTLSEGGKPDTRSQRVEGAVSGDGERIYWSLGASGKLYVREHARKGQSAIAAGKCTELEAACTYPVSETVSGGKATFWKANPAGSVALFTLEGSLYRFNVATKKSLLVAGEVVGLLGASEDLARIYLVSKEDKDGGGSAAAGQSNIYRYENGTLTYVAALSATEAAYGSRLSSPVSLLPLRHSARVSSDGKTLAFESNAKITGFDNAEVNSAKPAAEVYRYSSESGKVLCISCNRSGARPLGRNLGFAGEEDWVSAQLPTWQTQLDPTHPLTDDGTRIFFESYDALVSRDKNEALDVYEWEAPGTGSCEEDSPSFFADNGGCVYLISTGQSEQDSIFLDATPEGSDIFIGTASSLLSQDPDKLDVYDARVEGGFPSPPVPNGECEEGQCQQPEGEPAVQSPGSSAAGQGNLAGPKALRCGAGLHKVKRHRKTFCARKKHHRKKHPRHHHGKRHRSAAKGSIR
jgi:DNA-binding beta-propeller fold protein YncE